MGSSGLNALKTGTRGGAVEKEKVPTGRRQKRDAAGTREKILKVGIKEFCANGYGGARTARIARRANCNIRMIYHYFGSKEALYIAALERVYTEIRAREEDLDLYRLDPVEGIAALVKFTFDHMAQHQDFVQLATIENIQRGKYLKRSKSVPKATALFIEAISDLLRRGRKDGSFREDVDPVQLYISILALSYVHLSNKFTLSITYGENLQDPGWLAARRQHVQDMVLGYLRP